jgi:hypothetical protein
MTNCSTRTAFSGRTATYVNSFTGIGWGPETHPTISRASHASDRAARVDIQGASWKVCWFLIVLKYSDILVLAHVSVWLKTKLKLSNEFVKASHLRHYFQSQSARSEFRSARPPSLPRMRSS